MSATQPTTRREDARLVTGRGRYVDDLAIAGCLRGYVVRSSQANARLVAVDASAARAHPGVVCVLTGAEAAREGVGCLPGSKAPIGNEASLPSFLPEWPVLARDRVRFVGDPIAFVVAESATAAKDAAELVEVFYDDLPAVASLAEAVTGMVAVWDARPGNLAFVHHVGDIAAVDRAFAEAEHVVSLRLEVPRVTASPMEPRGHAAIPTDAGVRVVAGVQDVYGARAALARVLGRDELAFEVAAPDVGGSFGMKGVDVELVLVTWAAMRLGRPVRWSAERNESFLSDYHGRDILVEGALALAAGGRFLGLRVETLFGVGAYVGPSTTGPAVNNLGSLAGVYRTPAIAVTVKGVFTNQNPTAPYRGAGRPEAAYVLERLVETAARRLAVDPVELRRRNMIRPEQMPFRTGLTFTYDCGEFEALMETALQHLDPSALTARRAAARKAGRLHGIGYAAVIERSTFPGSFETVEVGVSASGDVLVLAGSTDQGQGHGSMYARVVAQRLGVDEGRIRVIEGDSARLPHGGMTGSSRVAAMGSSAALAAVQKVIEKGRRIAAHALEASEQDVEFADGRFAIVGTDRTLDLAEVAAFALRPKQLPADVEPGLAERGTHVCEIENFPNGFHACEVAVDPDTGGIEILRYVVVDDVGNMINPEQVYGQIHGGIVQSVGEVLLEQIVHDGESGQLLTGSFMDYGMPRAGDVPTFEVHSRPVPTGTNPLGVKGVGEAGTVGALPAVANAVIAALAPLGIEHIDIPLTPERIWRAVRDAEARRPVR